MTREKAIKIVKEFINDSHLHMVDKEALETLIPELTESKDERIRMALCDIVRDMPYMETELRAHGLTVEKTLAYLEKQKEYFQSGKGLYYYDGEKTVYGGYPATEENPYDFAMSQQEEKQRINTDGDFARGYDCGYECCLNSHGAEWLEKQKEQKPAEWSEDIIRKAVREVGLTQHQIDWFKVNVFPPKQEWSEEEEQLLNTWLFIIDKNEWRMDANFCEDTREFIARLKSLRSQPHWKPSELQMVALDGCIEHWQGNTYQKEILESLYEQLKKLM